ncbi:MAG: ribosomal L7Ae/L30e/S12e/Gadd45 family protein [Oscillospiraceae bacterium]|nr:ribosomal L7Ae/L30e/S12e/Gadd45 family protein [Oscillospiraceae bacterium]
MSNHAGIVGLAARAGKLICGTAPTIRGMKSGLPVYVVLIAANASANTQERIGRLAQLYRVPIRHSGLDNMALARATGREGMLSCVAIIDKNMAAGVL